MSATQQAQIQRRYKAVKHRRQKRDEDERKRIEDKNKRVEKEEPVVESGAQEVDLSKYISLEMYKALERDNNARVSELIKLKQHWVSFRRAS